MGSPTATVKSLTIALFRNDLRIHDNPIISYSNLTSIKDGGSVIKNQVSDFVLPVYVFDERQVELSGLSGYKRKGSAARTEVCQFWRTGSHRLKFLVDSVYGLKEQLRKRNSDLLIRFGIIESTILKIIKDLQKDGFRVDRICVTSEAAAEESQTEKKLERLLNQLTPKVPLTLFHSRSLVHPNDLPFPIEKTPDFYTPFRQKIESLANEKMCRRLLPTPEKFLPYPNLPESICKAVENESGYSGSLCDDKDAKQVFELLLKPLLDNPDDFQSIDQQSEGGYRADKRTAFPYGGGETEALRRLDEYFFQGKQPPVRTYKETRNGLLGESYSTKFSPFLALGCISPRKIIWSLRNHEEKFGANKDTYWVLFEILWRDYFIFITLKYGSSLFKLKGFEGLLNPKGAAEKYKKWKPFRNEKMNQSRTKAAPIDRNALSWLKARTGVPFLDANIRELILTGFMSNRGRQNVASFLTKDLGLDWRIGAEFFESILLDYDPCSNYGNWQYVAGVGNDPRSARQFNPIKQAKDYDFDGRYVKHWIPELKNAPIKKIHTPWLLNQQEQEQLVKEAGFGEYPRRPILEQQMWKKHYNRK
ncbi:DNA photolyase, FAD-binding/Cryptochrome [Phakopsora pachyrhizi]|uniref:Cryptochrome DASH n=1 Tax=Phakopsora pachyrhizi TaxID=170000 RepID=A0AAV0BP07_PHAPC|nr:DNA photolyase, FAD-binding/Cryptochrome [Phakopsora pachyrhizi]CAH7688089.1 DNA photolyase, FAD-binding/Cryptochrome [Phakopsora pachyrhizi]